MKEPMRLLSLLLAFLANSAWAADVIPIQTQKLPVGTLLVYETSSGGAEVRRVVRNDEQGLQIDALSASNSRPVKYSIVTDAQGRVIAKRYPSGREQTFYPHSCFRTLGSCEFEFVNAIGDKHRRKYRSIQEDGTVHVEMMNEHNHVLREYQLVFDKAGMIRYSRSSDPRSADKPPHIMRLVAIVEPGDRLPSGISLSE